MAHLDTAFLALQHHLTLEEVHQGRYTLINNINTCQCSCNGPGAEQDDGQHYTDAREGGALNGNTRQERKGMGREQYLPCILTQTHHVFHMAPDHAQALA